MNRERENPRAMREQSLFEIGQEVDKMEDKLGEKIDPGIRDTLIAVKAHEIPTSGSCEGHDNRAEALPWIQIENPEPDGWKEDDRLKELWQKWNTRDANKIKKLLVEWYDKRKEEGESINKKTRLFTSPIGRYGAVRLEPMAQYEISGRGKITEQDKKSREEKDLEPYKAEMKNFGEFLRQKFLEE